MCPQEISPRPDIREGGSYSILYIEQKHYKANGIFFNDSSPYFSNLIYTKKILFSEIKAWPGEICHIEINFDPWFQLDTYNQFKREYLLKNRQKLQRRATVYI